MSAEMKVLELVGCTSADVLNDESDIFLGLTCYLVLWYSLPFSALLAFWL